MRPSSIRASCAGPRATSRRRSSGCLRASCTAFSATVLPSLCSPARDRAGSGPSCGPSIPSACCPVGGRAAELLRVLDRSDRAVVGAPSSAPRSARCARQLAHVHDLDHGGPHDVARYLLLLNSMLESFLSPFWGLRIHAAYERQPVQNPQTQPNSIAMISWRAAGIYRKLSAIVRSPPRGASMSASRTNAPIVFGNAELPRLRCVRSASASRVIVPAS